MPPLSVAVANIIGNRVPCIHTCMHTYIHTYIHVFALTHIAHLPLSFCLIRRETDDEVSWWRFNPGNTLIGICMWPMFMLFEWTQHLLIDISYIMIYHVVNWTMSQITIFQYLFARTIHKISNNNCNTLSECVPDSYVMFLCSPGF